MKLEYNRFLKGINRRFSIDNADDPTRLYTLQNARLGGRGSTMYVERIKGLTSINTTVFGTIVDFIFLQNFAVILHNSSGTYTITIIDVTNPTTAVFQTSYTDTNFSGIGKLSLLDQYIYIAPHNKFISYINGIWALQDFISTTPTGTATAILNNGVGTLSVNTTYWYEMRYVYFDGHKTKTCLPIRARTDSTNTSVQLTINTVTDLDGNYADIEIFRKEAGYDFYLIDRVTPTTSTYTYTDDGKGNKYLFSDETYVWDKSHQTQTIVRDRYVRANLNYTDRQFSITELLQSITSTQNNILPYSTNFQLYARPKYTDGTLGFFESIGNFDTGTTDVQFQVEQTGLAGTDVKEIGYYGTYKAKGNSNVIPFNSIELYNQNLPSIATKGTAAEVKPPEAYLFMGFKYIYAKLEDTGDLIFYAVDSEWNNPTNLSTTNVDITSGYPFGWVINTQTGQTSFPTTIDLNLVSGQSVKYSLYVKTNNSQTSGDANGLLQSAVYKIAWFDGFSDMVTDGKGVVSITNSGTLNLSSLYKNSEILDYNATITGLYDTSSEGQDYYHTVSNGYEYVYPALTSRIYAIVNDNLYNAIDNPDINRYVNKYDGSTATDYTYTLQCEIKNALYDSSALVGDTSGVQYSDVGTTHTGYYYFYNQGYQVQTLNYDNLPSNSVIYLGTKPNQIDSAYVTFDYTGYVKTETTFYKKVELDVANIYDTIVLKSDLQTFQTSYPNQIIWSGEYVLGSNSSGIRNFTYDNFLNISKDYGEIIDIEYVGSRLFVFCERGLAEVRIGEVLTQQSSGSVYVNSSKFLTSYDWILRNVPNIQPKSIILYEDMIFFSDSLDVWMYSGRGLKNITDGAITLANGELIGAIDPYNKEYRISDGTQTWSYSIAIDQWFGPYTYIDQGSSIYGEDMYSIVNNKICQQNSGFTFDGTAYTTEIVSVANYMTMVGGYYTDPAPADDKLYRKFYAQFTPTTTGVTFSLSNDNITWYDYALDTTMLKRNLFNIGVVPQVKHSQYILWKVSTQLDNFLLKQIAFRFSQLNRL